MKALIEKIKQQPLTKLLIGFLAMVALLIIVVVKKQPQVKPLEVVSSTPPSEATEVSVYTNIKLNFNRPLANLNEVRLGIEPQIQIKVDLSEDQQTIVVDPVPPLHPNQTYAVTVFGIEAQKPLIRFSFTTQHLQTDPALLWERDRYIEEKFPLIDLLPYETNQFVIYGTSQPLTLEVLIKTEPIDTIKQAVYSWIQAQRVKPDSFKIRWFNPQLTPIP